MSGFSLKCSAPLPKHIQELREKDRIKKRLEYLRGELNEERISYEEIAELQSLAAHIAPDDVQLLEAAGVPEFTDDRNGH